MANTLDNLFQTLLAATNDSARVLKFQNTFIESIFWGNEPVAAAPYTTLNVIVPTVDESDVNDIGGGPLQPSDTRHGGFPVSLNKRFSTSFIVKTWDQGRSAADLRSIYVDARLEAFARKINRTIAAIVNTTNFANYTIISGAGADKFERADLTNAWVNLANIGAPMERLNLTTSALAYGNMLGDSNFINQYIVGDTAAVAAQQRAKLMTLYGANVRYDQHLEKFNSGKEPGVMYHPYAIAGLRREPTMLGSPVNESVVNVFGIPVLVQMEPQMKDGGWLVNYEAWWGVAPARTELATLLQTA